MFVYLNILTGYPIILFVTSGNPTHKAPFATAQKSVYNHISEYFLHIKMITRLMLKTPPSRRTSLSHCPALSLLNGALLSNSPFSISTKTAHRPTCKLGLGFFLLSVGHKELPSPTPLGHRSVLRERCWCNRWVT